MSIATLKEKNRTIEILLVEDNYGDALLTKKAFEKTTVPVNITVVEDGEKAINILTKRNDDDDSFAIPDIILLDINLPRLNGKEVLEKIKQHALLKHIPIIMLTSSSAELDVVKSYGLHANSYIVKPTDLSKFSDIVKAMEMFWFNLVVLPDESDITSNSST